MATLIDTNADRVRHPEKANKPDTEVLRKPKWIRVKAPTSKGYAETRKIVKDKGLVTVCEEAACPNIGECWEKSHATFMILGEICTRACAFCNVSTGLPQEVDKDEPHKIGEAVSEMKLQHVVITSVDRDDLADGGAQHFVDVIRAIRKASPVTTIEILTPDFLRKTGAAETVIDAKAARYYHSLRLLEKVKDRDPSQFTKSGLMVGLGETKEEIMQVMDDMRSAGVDFLTIGQYLQPTRKHAKLERFVTPEEFKSYETIARAKGFLMVSASPLTRSSYHADSDFAQLRAARDAQLGL